MKYSYNRKICSFTHIPKEVADKVGNGIACHAEFAYIELHSILNLFSKLHVLHG